MTLRPRLSPCAPLAHAPLGHAPLSYSTLTGGTLPHHRPDPGARPPAPEPITSFTGPFAFLANSYPAPFEFQAWGDTWTAPTVEHAFQALKAGTGAQFQDILASASAAAAWQAGQTADLRGDCGDWDDVRIDTMRDLVARKFVGNPDLALRLEETGAAPLIEVNTWHDAYWGVCACGACPAIGANVLGAVLMGVREAGR